VIKRMRDLLRNGQPEMQALDLNAIVRDVLGLLGSDIVIRNVSVTVDLDERPTSVHGDRVQLEQVLLNLLLNAMEAIAERPGGDRTVNLCTRVTDDGQSVLASVDDSGPGLPTGIGETLFEPFFTTKRTGMGMGLAIARSIIEAHGGKIWAENGSRGALFCFRLPRVTDGVAAEPLAPPRETNTP
jgi:signal transduction histidine kinase